MEIIQAKHAGFCEGVKKSVELAVKSAEKSNIPICTLGPLAHNPDVVNYLAGKGLKIINEVIDIPAGWAVVIRTHGVGPEVYEQLKSKDNKIIDGTCPRVKNVQNTVAKEAEKGKQIIIIGDPNHPEVIGIKKWARDNVLIFNGKDNLSLNIVQQDAVIVAQTTLVPEDFNNIVDIIKEKHSEVKVCNTICKATQLRQKAVVELAQKVDLMIVIGGRNSSNTQKLVKLCQNTGTKTHQIASSEEIYSIEGWAGVRIVGVAAGASTPNWTIKEVIGKMEEKEQEAMEQESLDQEENDSLETGEQETLQQEENENLETGEQVEGNKESAWINLEEALENKETLTGKVKEAVQAGLIVTLDLGLEGFMPGSLVDVKFIPDFNEFVGKEVEFKVIEINREKNKVILSRKLILEKDVENQKKKTLESLKEGEVISGQVKRLTDFGAFVDVGGIDGLVHISEISWKRIDHPRDVLNVGDEVKVKILEVIPEKERIGLSLRKAQKDPWSTVEDKFSPGDILTGKVIRLVNFGAFVELVPGVEGLVHISQIADYHIKQPSEVMSENQEVKIKILDINLESKRISLSMKDAEERIREEEISQVNNDEGSGVTLGDVFGSLFDKDEKDK